MEAAMGITTTTDYVADGLERLRFLFVNLYLLGTPDEWVVVDAGLEGCTKALREAAAETFGPGAKPKAFIMTHAHFDHIGAFPEIFDTWDVPIFAHQLEMPFLTGGADYPAPDPTVGKGAMALMSFAYPNKGIDLGSRAKPLPDDGSVPFMPGWRWVHSPGHTPGHVAFFRESDRCLIAGDAFVTTKQESLYAVMTQREEVQGPPAYFTPDWVAARHSVERLAALNPAVAATGHGTPMRGPELRDGLATLVADFDEIALPDQGRYVPEHT
jgi:glyoxylase-like metal-dependent hydrolase (beta-lactamase superfamily II)